MRNGPVVKRDWHRVLARPWHIVAMWDQYSERLPRHPLTTTRPVLQAPCMGSSRARRNLAAAAATALALAATTPAHAATVIHPTRTNDPSTAGTCPTDCSLRQAIASAAAGDTISLAPPAPAGPYVLGQGALDIEKNLTIVGVGARSSVLAQAMSPANVLTIGQSATASVTVSGVTITDGSGRSGGGVYVGSLGTLALDAVSVIGNNGVPDPVNQQGSFGGGIESLGTLTVTNSTIANNTVTSVAGNGGNGGAVGGGIFVGSGTASIANTTIAGNRAVHPASTSTASGGGIATQGPLTLANVTLAGNTAGSFGGNLEVTLNMPIHIRNTIVSGGSTTVSMGTEDCYVTPSATITESYNLEDRNQCHFSGTGDQINTDPQLSAMTDNGGPTDTRGLPLASPAVDHGNPAGCTDLLGAPLTVDQRGLGRPTPCDIGAFEGHYPPVNGGTPAISGTAAVGQPLTCSSGTWSGHQPIGFGYAWERDGATIDGAAQAVHAVTDADAGHALSCHVTATNLDGSASADSSAVAVPVPTQPVVTAVLIETAPLLRPSSFRAAGAGASIAVAKPAIGTRVMYSVSVPATTTFTIEHAVSGRKSGGRCVAKTRRNTHAKVCTRYVAVTGSFMHADAPGPNSLHFSGRLAGHKLPAGTYLLVATGRDMAGKAAPANQAAFRIVS
jgi:hypothetical protein